tara:strand:- start:499 stop:813 length:315 start_codon:yes stop_codon:yes gene_type:complete
VPLWCAFIALKMSDKRKNNGGNCTVSTGGIDRRKNKYKGALDIASTVDDVVEVLHALKTNAFNGDTAAAKIYLEYYIGKPTVVIEQDTHITAQSIDIAKIFADK